MQCGSDLLKKWIKRTLKITSWQNWLAWVQPIEKLPLDAWRTKHQGSEPGLANVWAVIWISENRRPLLNKVWKSNLCSSVRIPIILTTFASTQNESLNQSYWRPCITEAKRTQTYSYRWAPCPLKLLHLGAAARWRPDTSELAQWKGTLVTIDEIFL